LRDRLVGERLIGASQHLLGDQRSARLHVDRALADVVISDHRSDIIRFEMDQRIPARVYLGRILWLLGFPDQAMRAAHSAVEDAHATNHAMTLCHALAMAACPIALLVGDLAAAEHYVEMLLHYSARHALARWGAFCRSYQRVLLIKRGNLDSGLRLLRAAFEEHDEAGFTDLRVGAFLGEFAEGMGRAGQIAAGLAAIDKAIDHSARTEERWIVSEFLRVKGELLLLQGGQGAAAAAEDHFRQALDWARRQGALSWELRAATSLAQLWRDQGRSADASAFLQPVYDRFTEGFATPDLQEAKSLLEKLASEFRPTSHQLRGPRRTQIGEEGCGGNTLSA
jgi:predicted ATPase